MSMGFLQPGGVELSWHFVSAVLSIVLVDLILAGDNAVVIAMAVRSLSPEQRRKGILLGAGAAVLLRIVATFFVSQMLRVPFLKLVGGILILWIAVKLFSEGAGEEDGGRKATTIAHAVRLIVVADITMSTDNMLAVAGVSKGNFYLLLFGLALSIPFVVFTSNLLSYLMDKYPAIVYVGAAVLGKVGGEMIIEDPSVESVLHPAALLRYAVMATTAIGVIVVGKLLERRAIVDAAAEATCAGSPEGNEEG